jgi:hypothetical protein
VYADQCPYFREAVRQTLETAAELGVQRRQSVELRSAREVRDMAPCPYGTFGIVYDGALLSCTPLGTKRLTKRLQELRARRVT